MTCRTKACECYKDSAATTWIERNARRVGHHGVFTDTDRIRAASHYRQTGRGHSIPVAQLSKCGCCEIDQLSDRLSRRKRKRRRKSKRTDYTRSARHTSTLRDSDATGISALARENLNNTLNTLRVIISLSACSNYPVDSPGHTLNVDSDRQRPDQGIGRAGARSGCTTIISNIGTINSHRIRSRCSCRERHNSSTVIGSIENRAGERGIPSKVRSSKASAHSRTQGNKSATEEWKPVRSVDRYQNRPAAERPNLSGSGGNVSNNRVILKS